jgi:hypothetical protein
LQELENCVDSLDAPVSRLTGLRELRVCRSGQPEAGDGPPQELGALTRLTRLEFVR